MEPRTLNTGPYDSDFDDPAFGADLGGVSKDDRTWGMLAHLSALSGFVVPFGNVLGPLIIWLVKRDESAFVDDQGREALNFQITITIASVVSIVLMLVLIGIALMAVVAVAWLVLSIVAGVKANEGKRYRYPFTLRLIK